MQQIKEEKIKSKKSMQKQYTGVNEEDSKIDSEEESKQKQKENKQQMKKQANYAKQKQ